MKQKVVVIGHGYTSRLAVIRSVAQLDCEITVIVMTGYKRNSNKLNTKKPIDGYSKYVNQLLYCHYDDEEGLIKLLLNKCVSNGGKTIIIPDSDFSASVIDKNQLRLNEKFLFPHIHHTPGTVIEWMDKTKQKELALKIGLNVPSSRVVNIVNHKYRIPNDVNYPCFVKPMITLLGGKSIFRRCDNEEELCESLNVASDIADMNVLIEDFKCIDVEYAVLGFSNGKDVIIPGIIQIQDLAHGGHFGVACRGKIMPIEGFEELIEKFKKFILNVGFVGVFDIDFYKSDEELYFGELNLRIGGSMYAYTKMGVNLPGMLVKTLIGESISDMQKQISNTATYVNERMCLDDWYYRFITTKEYKEIIGSGEISFVKDNDDKKPFSVYQKSYREKIIKRIIKGCISSLRNV